MSEDIGEASKLRPGLQAKGSPGSFTSFESVPQPPNANSTNSAYSMESQIVRPAATSRSGGLNLGGASTPSALSARAARSDRAVQPNGTPPGGCVAAHHDAPRGPAGATPTSPAPPHATHPAAAQDGGVGQQRSKDCDEPPVVSAAAGTADAHPTSGHGIPDAAGAATAEWDDDFDYVTAASARPPWDLLMANLAVLAMVGWAVARIPLWRPICPRLRCFWLTVGGWAGNLREGPGLELPRAAGPRGPDSEE